MRHFGSPRGTGSKPLSPHSVRHAARQPPRSLAAACRRGTEDHGRAQPCAVGLPCCSSYVLIWAWTESIPPESQKPCLPLPAGRAWASPHLQVTCASKRRSSLPASSPKAWVEAPSPRISTSSGFRCDVGGWTREGGRRATHLFEAAAWYQAVRPVCRCGHSATFDPYGLWWKFQRKMWTMILARRAKNSGARAARHGPANAFGRSGSNWSNRARTIFNCPCPTNVNGSAR